MLNTDLHNPQVKKKMSKEEFLKNNRGINEGENLPSDFLEDLYERIKNDEIKMKSDGGKWAKATKKGWLQMGKNKDSPKKLWFVLTESTLYWFKKMGVRTCYSSYRVLIIVTTLRRELSVDDRTRSSARCR